jgi:hypothetical protein
MKEDCWIQQDGNGYHGGGTVRTHTISNKMWPPRSNIDPFLYSFFKECVYQYNPRGIQQLQTPMAASWQGFIRLSEKGQED